MLLKKIKGDTNKCKFTDWKNVKTSSLSKVIYRFNAIDTKIPRTFYTEIEKLFLKFVWNLKEP